MQYALVQDVPASWERYQSLAAEFAEPVPAGLILHVAGQTDEGFRTIEVWETREAWERFEAGLQARGVVLEPGGLVAPTLRELDVLDLVRPTRDDTERSEK